MSVDMASVRMRSFLLLVVSATLCSALVLSGCQTNTGDSVKDARGRATNQALYEAGRVLGSVAVSTLFNVAQQEATGGTADFAQAASDGLWKNAGSIVSSGSVERIIQAYSGEQMPKTAQAAANVFQAQRTNLEVADVTNAIASVISTAAGTPPGK